MQCFVFDFKTFLMNQGKAKSVPYVKFECLKLQHILYKTFNFEKSLFRIHVSIPSTRTMYIDKDIILNAPSKIQEYHLSISVGLRIIY